MFYREKLNYSILVNLVKDIVAYKSQIRLGLIPIER